jgi:protein-disulfide isomerase
MNERTTKPLRILAAAVITASMLAVGPSPAQTQRSEVEDIVKDYLANNPEVVQRIVKDYLVNNPEVLRNALAELLKRRTQGNAAAAADKAAAIKANVMALFNSSRHVTLGNPQGDVTLVEFFDYNCGFCKRALNDKLDLIKADPKLKLVLKEFPVLGQGSREAAQVAVAVRVQDATGAKYLEFHRKLMGERMRADRESALAVARELGLDMARLEADLAGSEVAATLEESMTLAGALGINGTPSYVVGESVVVGAVGRSALADKIKAARN